jgi:dephospho-CoA kinase
LEALFQHLVRLLHEVGLAIVFAVTFTETAFFIGLLIPAEATILVAAFLSARGYFSVVNVFLVTFFGGLLGDQAGYLLGRYGGGGLIARKGRIAEIWRRNEPRVAHLFTRHASLSVSLARFISFVRTVMPWFAGMTKLPYGRFLVYDIIGVLGWAALSVGLGYAAEESWEAAAHILGRTSAILLGVIVLIGLFALIRARRRQKSLEAAALRTVLRVALTGNIASGKSSVAEAWRSLGASVIDADVLARRAVEPGTPGHAAVLHAFGEEVVSNDGTVDRARLRQRVFAEPEERAKLEAILHPEIAKLRDLEEHSLLLGGASIIVSDIPLLFETGLDDQFDVVVHVHSSAATRERRLVELRGMAPEQARAIMAAQLPSEEKRERSHIVIDNEGTLEELHERAGQVWEELKAWPHSA